MIRNDSSLNSSLNSSRASTRPADSPSIHSSANNSVISQAQQLAQQPVSRWQAWRQHVGQQQQYQSLAQQVSQEYATLQRRQPRQQ